MKLPDSEEDALPPLFGDCDSVPDVPAPAGQKIGCWATLGLIGLALGLPACGRSGLSSGGGA
jgi:hypothetical protein